MSNTIVGPDPYFDDEDEINEDNYRELLRTHGKLPACDPKTLPTFSLSQRCILCSRIEAENILKKLNDIQPGNFIVRPSVYPNHPYSLSVLSNENCIYHFQIGQISDKYVLGPLETVDLLKSKTFLSLSAFLEYYLTSPIQFRDDNHKEHSIVLKLYPMVEVTSF